MSWKRFCTRAIAATYLLSALSSPALAGDVSFIAVLDVPEENQAAFDALARRMVAAASENEGLLVYEFARSGTRVYGYERYVDAQAHARHEEILAPYLSELTELASFERIVTLSPLADDHRVGFEAIGAEIGAPIAGIAKGDLGD